MIRSEVWVETVLIPSMPPLITLNYNPLDCACWDLPDGQYCEYCNWVCGETLEDFESGVGNWALFGCPGE